MPEKPKSLTSHPVPEKAGRELDALIAEGVMGWKRGTRYGAEMWLDSKGRALPLMGGATPAFSTKIADAWSVVEKVDNRNAVAKEMGIVAFTLYRYDNGYTARFFNSGATAETAPLAICLAALSAFRVPLEKEEK